MNGISGSFPFISLALINQLKPKKLELFLKLVPADQKVGCSLDPEHEGILEVLQSVLERKKGKE